MKDVDLNLLGVFDAIMTERSVTKAAERLAMTQPAVSNAVSRMRHAYGDPLFVKNGRGIQPTPKAITLWQQIREPLHNLREAVDPPAFEPGRAARRFRIATTDVMTQLVWLPLRQLLEREAPGIDIHAVPYTTTNGEKLLADAEADMVIGMFNDPPRDLRTAWLFDSASICAMRRDHPLAKAPLTLDRYLAADHLVVSLSGEPTSPVDQQLAQMGYKRRIAMTVNQFASVPELLKGSDLICVAPRTVVTCSLFSGELHLVPPPFDIPNKGLSLAWHARHDRDPGHAWLRENLIAIAVQRWEEYGRCWQEGQKRHAQRSKAEVGKSPS
ncbi:MAG: LysR family transcriptional regulator [Gammaproteobacteria bacterium]|nr:LysR family transcriptional regulator [Gammaproteobacteria bacterium]